MNYQQIVYLFSFPYLSFVTQYSFIFYFKEVPPIQLTPLSTNIHMLKRLRLHNKYRAESSDCPLQLCLGLVRDARRSLANYNQTKFRTFPKVLSLGKNQRSRLQTRRERTSSRLESTGTQSSYQNRLLQLSIQVYNGRTQKIQQLAQVLANNHSFFRIFGRSLVAKFLNSATLTVTFAAKTFCKKGSVIDSLSVVVYGHLQDPDNSRLTYQEGQVHGQQILLFSPFEINSSKSRLLTSEKCVIVRIDWQGLRALTKEMSQSSYCQLMKWLRSNRRRHEMLRQS